VRHRRPEIEAGFAVDWETTILAPVPDRFPALAKATKMPPKSLMRMFGPKGNPTAVNLFGVIVALQHKTRVHLEVRAVADAA
jgi:hypothetical protein